MKKEETGQHCEATKAHANVRERLRSMERVYTNTRKAIRRQLHHPRPRRFSACARDMCGARKRETEKQRARESEREREIEQERERERDRARERERERESEGRMRRVGGREGREQARLLPLILQD